LTRWPPLCTLPPLLAVGSPIDRPARRRPARTTTTERSDPDRGACRGAALAPSTVRDPVHWVHRPPAADSGSVSSVHNATGNRGCGEWIGRNRSMGSKEESRVDAYGEGNSAREREALRQVRSAGLEGRARRSHQRSASLHRLRNALPRQGRCGGMLPRRVGGRRAVGVRAAPAPPTSSPRSVRTWWGRCPHASVLLGLQGPLRHDGGQ